MKVKVKPWTQGRRRKRTHVKATREKAVAVDESAKPNEQRKYGFSSIYWNF